MRRIVVISPWSGRVARNRSYLDRCILDVLKKGDAPYASHGLYPRVIDDSDPAQREQGIQAGHAWLECAELAAVYVDHGVSDGMKRDIDYARSKNILIEIRSLAVTT